MSILLEIYDGWKNLIFENPEAEELAKKRIEICVECDDFKKSNKTCNLCGCYMPAKVRSRYSSCAAPKKKW
jgi:hypothetical protein